MKRPTLLYRRRFCGVTIVAFAYLAAALAMAAPRPAGAAPLLNPTNGLPKLPVEVVVARSADPRCASNECIEWISLEGPIGPGSFDRFARVLRGMGHGKPAILIDSPGGLVNEAMAIGRLIRERHLDVAVSRTRVISCPAEHDACKTLTPDQVVLGEPDAYHAFCASACPLILAAGTRRFVGPWSFVGVHQFKMFASRTMVSRVFRVVWREVNGRKVEVSRTLVSQRPLSTTYVRVPPDYARAKAYLIRMGMAPSMLDFYDRAPPDGIYWMSRLDLHTALLATDDRDGEYLVAHGDSAAPAASQSTSTTAVLNPGAGPAENPQWTADTALLERRFGVDERLQGSVVWSVDASRMVSDGSPAVLVASVSFPGHPDYLVLRLDGADAMSLPRHLSMSLALVPFPDFHVLSVGSPDLIFGTRASPVEVSGQVTTSRSDRFDMVLSAGLMLADQIMPLKQVEIPVLADQGRPVEITLTLGASGRAAITPWQALGQASAPHA